MLIFSIISSLEVLCEFSILINQLNCALDSVQSLELS